MTGSRLLAVASVAAVLLQLPGRLGFTVGALGLQLLAMTLWDRDALRRLGRLRLWALASTAALLSGLILAPPAGHLGPIPYSLQGVRIAALMLGRAVTLYGVALVASRQLTADRVLRATQRLGIRQVGVALSVALQTLPRLTAAARRERSGQASGVAPEGPGRVARLERLGIRLLLRAESIVQDLATAPGQPEPGAGSPPDWVPPKGAQGGAP